MKPTVIDANCISYFQKERLTGASGIYSQVVTLSLEVGGIAIDSGGQAMQEYNDCCKPSAVGLNLQDWIAEMLLKGSIKLYEKDDRLKSELTKLGLPNKDLKWPAIAISAQSDYIVTEDIDLFDPKAKSWSAAKKSKVKSKGGAVSKLLKKKHSILVATADGFIKANAGPE